MIDIAKMYGTTYKKLAKYNNIKNPNRIEIGQEIKIPQVESDSLKVGDKVLIVANGCAKASGGKSTDCIGWTRFFTY